MSRLHALISKLDLSDFIDAFMKHYSREKSDIDIELKSEKNHLFLLLSDFDKLDLKPLPNIKNLNDQIAKLKKFGNLDIDEIYEFIKIIRYFIYLKNGAILELKHLFNYLEKIVIPQDLINIDDKFLRQEQIDKNYNNFKLKSGIYEEIDSILNALSYIQNDVKTGFVKLFSNANLSPYFVDKQIHLINNHQALLLKAGFNHALKGSITARSSSGFFYVIPHNILELSQKQDALKDRLEVELLKVSKELSATLQKHILFLQFIDREFDKIDSIMARINFAKSKNLNFTFKPHTNKSNEIILREFIHPNLSNPKPINVDFTRKILMVTGVNAGGKTILLKSILSAIFLNKFLLPMAINPNTSKLPDFKSIDAIISDPQNSKNDISTFAGRMLSFSEILKKDNLLLGVDEIELGTDADEASALYKVLLEELVKRDCKVIVTTHHKRLAQLMAKNTDVEMLAAIFDEHKMLPTYSFLQGSVGKSYAFESAIRYGIPTHIIKDAKALYGEDKENLNHLIENSTKLELELKNKQQYLDTQIQKLKLEKENLEELKHTLKIQNENYKNKLESIYNQALKELQNTAKNATREEIHKNINNANKILAFKKNLQSQNNKNLAKNLNLKIGDNIKYNTQKGKVESIKNKNIFVILDSGIRLKTTAENLEKIQYAIPKSKPKIDINYSVKSAKVSLDLHGKRSDEALDMTSEFIDNALLAGFDCVLIYHGIGTGRLSSVIKDFLSSHPKVLRYEDAPQNMGGFGAKMVYL